MRILLIQQQKNYTDCGIFVIPYAILYGGKVEHLPFNVTLMHHHLLVYLQLEVFPKTNLFYQLKTNDQDKSIAVDIPLFLDVFFFFRKAYVNDDIKNQVMDILSQTEAAVENTLHTKRSFPLRISSLNVTKSAVGKLHFLCSDGIIRSA